MYLQAPKRQLARSANKPSLSSHESFRQRLLTNTRTCENGERLKTTSYFLRIHERRSDDEYDTSHLTTVEATMAVEQIWCCKSTVTYWPRYRETFEHVTSVSHHSRNKDTAESLQYYDSNHNAVISMEETLRWNWPTVAKNGREERNRDWNAR